MLILKVVWLILFMLSFYFQYIFQKRVRETLTKKGIQIHWKPSLSDFIKMKTLIKGEKDLEIKKEYKKTFRNSVLSIFFTVGLLLSSIFLFR